MSRNFAIVVSGTPRSGTSLVMQMLAAGGVPLLVDELRPPDADNPRGYFEYAPVKRTARDASWFAGARGRAVKVIDALLPHLPEEGDLRVLFVTRDPREVLASQRRMVERSGAAWEDDDARLEAAFAEQARAARAWAVDRPRTAFLPLEHARLLAEPAAVAVRIEAFLGGTLDLEAMARCVDPSLHRNRV